MEFNSILYFVFLLIVFAACRFFNRYRNLILLLASYIFYTNWDWRFASLLMLSTTVDFLCAIEISESASKKRKKLFLLFSVFSNLSILFTFKYFNFFIDSFVALFGSQAFTGSEFLHVALPLGVSFYTFQTLGYTIDVFRGRVGAERSIIDYGLYVSFFPQLVAGPIERASKLLPQLKRKPKFKPAIYLKAVEFIVYGLLIKLVFADNFGFVVDYFFSNVEYLTKLDVLVTSYAFSFQIYGDFFGYTLIARGSALLFGIRLSRNFNHPFWSKSLKDFWHKWHISLSTWFRDYVYISLGGSRSNGFIVFRNVLVTFLLSGLWHGASFTFLLWGALHGLALSAENGLRKFFAGRCLNILIPILQRILTFHIVCFLFICFRSSSIGQFYDILGSFLLGDFMASKNASLYFYFLTFAFGFILFEVLRSLRKTIRSWLKKFYFVSVAVRSFSFGLVSLLLIVFGNSYAKQFIYFVF